MNEEIVASLRLLVAIAKADGKIHPNEELALESSLEGAELPKGTTVATLLADDINVEAEIARITSHEIQKRTLQAAIAMVYVDRHASASEKKILDHMRSAFNLELSDGIGSSWNQPITTETDQTTHRIDDPNVREKHVDEDIASTALWSAIWGAMPIPLVGEFVIMVSELRMLRQIAQRYGHEMDASFWKAFTANLVGVGASRFAVQSLMKLVPGWGSIAGASGSYATTWALGKAGKLYFDKGESIDPKSLKAAFKDLREEGLVQAKESRAKIDSERERIKEATAELEADLASGKIAESAYAEKIVALKASVTG